MIYIILIIIITLLIIRCSDYKITLKVYREQYEKCYNEYEKYKRLYESNDFNNYD